MKRYFVNPILTLCTTVILSSACLADTRSKINYDFTRIGSESVTCYINDKQISCSDSLAYGIDNFSGYSERVTVMAGYLLGNIFYVNEPGVGAVKPSEFPLNLQSGFANKYRCYSPITGQVQALSFCYEPNQNSVLMHEEVTMLPNKNIKFIKSSLIARTIISPGRIGKIDFEMSDSIASPTIE